MKWAEVGDYRVQPCPRGCRVAQVADASQGDQEGVVDGVLGLGAVPEHADGHGVQERAMALEQRAQAGVIAGLGGPDERRVVGRAHAAILLLAMPARTIPRRPRSCSRLRGVK